MALRVLAIGAALFAAGAPSFSGGGSRRRVLLIDASQSARLQAAGDVVERAMDGLADDDEIAVVAFGDGVRATEPLRVAAWRASAAADELYPAALARASRVGAALEEAAAVLRAAADGTRRDVVIVTDARATDDAEERARGAFALRAAGCEGVHIERIASHPPGPRVLHVRGPGTARRGDTISVLVDGVSGPAGARVELLEDARLLAAGDVAPGAFRVTFRVPSRDAAQRTFGARIAGGDIEGEARAHVVVVDPTRVLAFSDAARSSELRLVTGRDVMVRDAAQERDVAADLAACAIIVLDGVAARDMPLSTRRAVLEHVRGGGGLLVLGGPHAYAQGGWGAGAFEECWPLTPLPRDAPTLLVYLALDGSGSMAEPWPGGSGPRDAVVRAAAGDLVRVLPPGTEVALRRFAGDLLPNGAAPARHSVDGGAGTAALLAALSTFPAPGGATRLLPVLDEAARLAASRFEAPTHAIVFTDARSAESHAVLRAAVQAAGCGLTIVAPEDDDTGDVLDALRTAGAEVRTVAAAADVARAFQEAATTAAAGAAILEGRTARLVAGAREHLPGAAAPPGVLRAQRVFVADDADVVVQTDRAEPLAAVRGEGLGLIAAVATRPGDAAWLPEGDGGLVRALVGLLSGAAPPELRVERRGPDVLVAGQPDAVPTRLRYREAGGAREVELLPASHGLLRAAVPPSVPFAVVLAADGRGLGGVGLDVPAAPEAFDPDPVDLDALARLAASPRPPGGVALAPWLAALALLLLVVAHAWAARPPVVVPPSTPARRGSSAPGAPPMDPE